MTTLQIQTPRVFLPLIEPARYKGAHGGRMGMKSHFFAELMVERCLMDNTRCVCIREVQKSIKESVKMLLEDKIRAMGVSHLFEILETEIRHKKNGSLIIFRGMSTQTADSIKSLENFDIAWWEEAQTASQRSIELLRPTIIRKISAELWFSWNPDSEDDAIEFCMRGNNAWPGAVVVHTTYKDNYHLAPEIVAEIESDRARDPDQFAHVWLGDYRRTLDGAIYAKEIRELYESKRVCKVLPIPAMPMDYFFDLGHRDNTSIWGAQMRLGEYRIPLFYQNRGEKLQHYAEWIKAQGHPIGTIWLPHDADQERLVGKSIANSLRDLLPGVTIRVIPRMPKKAIGIEAVRRIFPNCYFDEENTRDGLKALGRFRYDVNPDTGGYSQNPLHDEHSDAADAFAQLALSLQEPRGTKKISFSVQPSTNSWMGA